MGVWELGEEGVGGGVLYRPSRVVVWVWFSPFSSDAKVPQATRKEKDHGDA
jgi:hypothetical protein